MSTRSSKLSSMPSRQAVEGAAATAAELFELAPDEWEKKTDPDKRAHLESLIEIYSRRSADDPVGGRKLPALYFALATLLGRSGEGAEALRILEQIPPDPQTESLLHLVRGQVYQNMEQPSKALGSYLSSFALDAQPWTWQRLEIVSRQLEVSQAELLKSVRRLLARGARSFPSFNLKTPAGENRQLADFSSQAILVNFFFPG